MSLRLEARIAESALQSEVGARAGAAAELAVLRGQLAEAIGELEERCRGAWAAHATPHVNCLRYGLRACRLTYRVFEHAPVRCRLQFADALKTC